MTTKTIVLFNGGLNSTTTLAIAKSHGYSIFAVSFDYDQKHEVELERAQIIANWMKVEEHKIININLRQFGGSALTDSINVPIHRNKEEMWLSIPITYVPARNTIFLSYALAYAKVKKSTNIFLG